MIESWRRHYNAVRPHAFARLSAAGARRSSSRRWPRGRLRALDPLRRPRSRQRRDLAKLTIQSDHSTGADHQRDAG